NFCDDIALMLGEERRPSKFWQICWKYISPIILVVTIVFSSLFYQDITLDDYTYPSWALALGWIVVILCVGWLPCIFLIEICNRGTWNIIKEARLPHVQWGPARDEHRLLSPRYARDIKVKTLSMQTLSTIDSANFDSDAIVNSNFSVKQISDIPITTF
ncbi:unnamed protein product, partial [Rotaria sp. Silwood2]